MNTYITLMKLTDQGAKDVKNAPKRVETAFKALEMTGGKLIGFYVTFGEYDYIGIGESPNDEAVAAYNLALSSLGNVRTMTLRAFTLEQFAGIVKKIP
jgi:uncharacterized protein with GYD domain